MSLQFETTDLATSAIEVFEQLVDQHDNCFLFESLADSEQPQSAGLSYIGVAPSHTFTARGNEFEKDGASRTVDNAYLALRQSFQRKTASTDGYCGGLVGYLSHEAIAYNEPSLSFSYERNFYDFQFGQYDDGLVFAPGQPTKYFHYGQDRLELYRQIKPRQAAPLQIHYQGASQTDAKYRRMVAKARADIIDGRVFQVVLARRYNYTYSGSLLALYKELRQINPSPFMFFLKFGDTITMGASPELLISLTADRQLYFEALAGTVARGKTAAQDRQLAKQLLADEKEQAEHNMLVDLGRNDLGRVSSIGSVQVDRLMYVKHLSHVQHLCSLIHSWLADGLDAFDALAACGPTGTLTGAPKIEAIKLITELETTERGPYGGSVGFVSHNGEAKFAVNIRSVSAAGESLYMHTGSGIVYDSQPAREEQEINAKKAALDHAIAPFITGDSA